MTSPSPTTLGRWDAGAPPIRCPDPDIIIHDRRFAHIALGNAHIERIATGFRFTEGPVWFGDGRYLLFSDIPDDRIYRWDETTGGISVFREPSHYTNGNTRDRQGRLISCEHDTQRVTRTEYDGTITVLADSWEGQKFTAPNDVVVKSDGTVWFTDNQTDGMGDDTPPGELNRITKTGGEHFGYPFIHGNNVQIAGTDAAPDLKGMSPPAQWTKPQVEFPAHQAQLGMSFYTGKMFPAKYQGGIFVAAHGSWNRTRASGGLIDFVSLKADGNADGSIFQHE